MCGDQIKGHSGYTFHCDGMHHDGDKTVALTTKYYSCGSNECNWGICEPCYWQEVQEVMEKDGPAEAMKNHEDIIMKMARKEMDKIDPAQLHAAMEGSKYSDSV